MNTLRAHEFILSTWEWFKMTLAEPMIAVSTIFADNKALIMLILLWFAILVFAFLFVKVFLDATLSLALTVIVVRRWIINFRLLSSCSSVNWAFLLIFLGNNFEWTWMSGTSYSIIICLSKLSSSSLLRGQGNLPGLNTLNLKRGILFTREIEFCLTLLFHLINI